VFKTPTDTLSQLRCEIDRIDLAMHKLLMQRGEIIDRLIEVKRAQGGGCAFRPDREAQMMRALVERHQGLLPLDAVEGIWRIIVSTFTYVQAHYSVHADDSGGDAQMRDSARFHFGFTVPYIPHHGAVAVIEAVERSGGDLGVLRSAGGSGDGAWWLRLVGESAPKIIARLPFVERPDHPAGLPVFVVAKPAAELGPQDIALHSVSLAQWSHAAPAAIAAAEGEILASAPKSGGYALLVAAPAAIGENGLMRELANAGVVGASVDTVGGHAARFEMNEARAGVFAPKS
jgi:chorismate mutase